MKIYEHDYWWSDSWDAMEYGRDYDFSRPFFDQMYELMLNVPFPNRNVRNVINSDYSDHCGDLTNCYLCFNISRTENSAYMLNGTLNKNSFDMTDASNTELSYDILSVGSSYQVFFSLDCEECQDVWFSKNCVGCSNCFGCVNLRNKQYHIFNQPYRKYEYMAKIKEFGLHLYGNFQAIRRKAEEFWTKFPNKYIHGLKNTNVSGDYIHGSKNVRYSFGVVEGENLKYCQEVYIQPGFFSGGKDSYDYYNWGYGSELMYEVYGSGRGCQNVRFCLDCWPADRDIEYCMRCASSSSLFGCIGLRNKSNCILNKQYTPEEYRTMRGKIIRHMQEMPYRDTLSRMYSYGEFFPQHFSLFAYNETPAQDYFPLEKEEALRRYTWRDIERKEFQTTVDAKDLPDSVQDAGDLVLNEIIGCVSCKRAYRIIASELEFLQKYQIPLPRLCPNCRYLHRFSYRNRPRYYKRLCMCAGNQSNDLLYQNQESHFHNVSPCPNEFETSYAPDRPEIVYCEACYQSEIF